MIAGTIRLLTGARARWIGCGPELKPRIYFANHASNLDGPVIWASLPPLLRRRTRPVAARDYWDKGIVRRFISKRMLNVVLIDRTNISAHNNPLTAMEAVLTAGDSLIIFPEGKRQGDEDAGLNPFKPGLWHLAKNHPQVELVPVWLENLNRILPRGEFILVPLMASVTFGTPLVLAEGEDKATFIARAQAAVAGLAGGAEV